MTTENPTGAPSPAPVDQQADPGPEHVEPSAPLFEAPTGAEDTGRYCVYDQRLGKYVGGVTSDKPSKADAKKLVGHDDVAVVEV